MAGSLSLFSPRHRSERDGGDRAGRGDVRVARLVRLINQVPHVQRPVRLSDQYHPGAGRAPRRRCEGGRGGGGLVELSSKKSV